MVEQERLTVQPVIARWRGISLVVGIIGIVLTIVGLVLNPEQFFASYLSAWLWVAGLSTAGLAMSMVHYLGGGRWGAAVGDVLRAQSALWWLLAIMFLPIFIGAWVARFYPWSQPAIRATDPYIQARGIWMTLPFWSIRTILYFVGWILIAHYLLKWFRIWDETGDPVYRRRLRNLSGAGFVFFFLSFSYAVFDWTMSMEPDWWSSIYGMMLVIGESLGGWAFMIFIYSSLRNRWPVSAMISRPLMRDLGSLMIANTILWAYTTFSQFMLIWVGNLNDEIPWYLVRLNNGWQWVGTIWMTTNFLINFPVLVMRGTRKNPGSLWGICLLVMIGRFIEDVWLVEPDFPQVPLLGHWLDIAAVAGLAGIWGWFFFGELGRRLVVVRPAAIFPSHQVFPVGPSDTPEARAAH